MLQVLAGEPHTQLFPDQTLFVPAHTLTRQLLKPNAHPLEALDEHRLVTLRGARSFGACLFSFFQILCPPPFCTSPCTVSHALEVASHG